MKLTMLKTQVRTASSGLAMVETPRPDVVQRKRGWSGVQDRNRIRARDRGLCQECKRQGRVGIGAAVDHIVPLWKGGSDEDSNKQLLCTPCHDAKSAREAGERARST
jgi:5-methylcytosine-specific restriction protein A